MATAISTERSGGLIAYLVTPLSVKRGATTRQTEMLFGSPTLALELKALIDLGVLKIAEKVDRLEETGNITVDPHFAHAGARRSCQGWPSHQPCGILRPCEAKP